MAVPRRTHGGDVAAGSWAVLDNEWLTEPFRQPLADQPCNNIDVGASGESDDDMHRPRRIGLRPSDARHRRQRGSAGGQMQKISAGKFHLNPPYFAISLDHLVGEDEQLVWHGHAKRLGSLLVDDQLKFGRQLHRQVGRLLAAENAVNVFRGTAKYVRIIDSVGYQPAVGEKEAERIN